jgi:hydroxymethylglutaryl-CoA lyase
MTVGSRVHIVEVGPRDGLQNEKAILPAGRKVELVEALAASGIKRIEVGSFVSAKQVPQMADTADVFSRLRRRPDVSYSALVPNLKGLTAAVQAGVSEVAIFASASETFSEKNIHSSIAESLERYRTVAVLGCPYEGHIAPEAVLGVSTRLFSMGCFEISLGDTIGSGTPDSTDQLLRTILAAHSTERIAVHFHDTGGKALDNIDVALERGVRVIDSSIAGLGGCPFAPGSPGNVATEQVVASLHKRGWETGIDEEQLASVAILAADMLGRRGRASSE